MREFLWRLLRGLPLLVLSPLLTLVPFVGLVVVDVLHRMRGKRALEAERRPNTQSASVVIPNWNGRDLLEKYLPSVVRALEGHPDNEVVVVDNGSSDGSAEFVREQFPQVKLVALKENLGFGGGSNAGFRAAKNDIVVLLNSDMRVEEGFLQPLLDGFSDEKVFAVSCQIFFTDPKKVREETGLTQAWWANGKLGVRHRDDPKIQGLYPCFYGGGGSCAFDKRKFFELGGFDHLLAPFYLEDTDLGYMAWKRGWKVLYQPASVVFHEHRGTIGKKFSAGYIQSVLKKNFLLFCWKNIHEWGKLSEHFFHAWADGVVSLLIGYSPERGTLGGLWRAFLQTPGAMASRWRARSLAAVSDTEAFRRPLGGYFLDRFQKLDTDPERLRVLFLSPYGMCPPIHGGGVFMYYAARTLAEMTDLHLVVLIDEEKEIEAHRELAAKCRDAEFVVRMESKEFAFGSIVPHAVREFANGDLEWLLHRMIYQHRIDVVQIEYTNMGQYGCEFHQIVTAIFEHDVYFQSIGRALEQKGSPVGKVGAAFEYLRALRYELRMLPRMDEIQVCSRENGAYLESFLPQLKGRIDDDLRAGIDTGHYEFRHEGREPLTMLFLGSFRHLPNQEALDWFVKRVLPVVVEKMPQARLVIVGSDPPPRHALPANDAHVEIRGFVADVQEPLLRYAVFVCPILSGSGVRVKLLEAFATGIPVVSTRVGAEGLATEDGGICGLSDDPVEFAHKILYLFEHPDEAAAMADRARAEVVAKRDLPAMTRKLESRYRGLVCLKRATSRR